MAPPAIDARAFDPRAWAVALAVVLAALTACGALALVVKRGWQRWRESTASPSPSASRPSSRPLSFIRNARRAARATLRVLASREEESGWWHRRRVRDRAVWCLVSGCPGAGRATALQQAGVQSVAGDADVATWRIAGRTLIVDMPWAAWAGRHAGDAQAAPGAGSRDPRAEAVSRALRRFRRARPIDAHVLLVPASLLRADRLAEAEAFAAAARGALRDWRRALGVVAGVHLVVTQLDHVTGFAETFADLGREAHQAAWGLVHGDGATSDAAAWLGRFDACVGDLSADAPVRMATERDLRRSERLLAFPIRFAGLRAGLQRLLTGIEDGGDGTVAERARILGVWFTSARQDADADDDRDADARTLSRTLGLVLGGEVGASPARARTRRAPARDTPRFLGQLFARTLADATPRAMPTARTRRRRRVGRALLGVAIVAAVVVPLATRWTTARRAADRWDELAVEATTFGIRVAELTGRDDAGPRSVAPLLGEGEALRRGASKPALHRWSVVDPARAMRPEVERHAQALRDRLLARAWWPRVDRSLDRALDPGRSLAVRAEALRLDEALHRSPAEAPAALGAWLLANDDDPSSRDAAADRGWPAWALHPDAALPASPSHTARAERTRADLAGRSLAERAWDAWAATLASREREGWAFRLGEAAGPLAARLFERAGGSPLSAPQAGAWRGAPWREAMSTELPSLVRALPAAQAQDVPGAIDAVRRRAADDLIAGWDALLRDVRLVDDGGDLAAIARQADALAAPDSPLRRLVAAVARETLAAARCEVSGTPLPGATSSASHASAPLLGRDLECEDDPIAAHFAGWRRVLQPTLGGAGNGAGSAEIDRLGDEFREFAAQLRASADAPSADPTGTAGGAPARALARLRAAAEGWPTPVRAWIDSLATRAEARVARRAREHWRAAMASDGTSLCREALEGRYPVVPAGDGVRDVPLTDFTRLFGPDGSFERLSRDAARTGDAGAATTMPAPLALAAERAAGIRLGFFPTGPAPAAAATLRLVALDEGVAQARLVVDGESTTMAPGGITSVRLAWPSRQAVPLVALSLVSAADDAGPALPVARSEGPWAAFRFVEAGARESASADRLRLVFGPPGHRATFELQAESVRHPWRLAGLRGFRCPS